MPNSWQIAYEELQGFIAEKPEVGIGESVISIPGDVRPEFYRLFGTVRSAFVEEKFPRLLNEAGTLSENYTKSEQEVTEFLGLDDVSMAAGLHRFLHNPRDGLIRGLFDPLFDLLKGKINAETFEQGVSRNIEASFRDSYRLGYEKWVLLSLIKLLDSDKSFRVILPRPTSHELIKHLPTSKESVPPPEESKRLSLEHQLSLIFTVPDFIVHSVKMGGYLAVRSEFRQAMWTASNASEQREWYPLGSIGALAPSLTLIYVAGNPEEISLVADADRICRPDLIIECREQKDWFEKEGLEKIKLHHDSLKPTLGTYIVSREPVPEQAYKELVPEQVSKEPASEQEQKPTREQEPENQGADIHILTVGFDQSKLEPIVSALMQPESK